MLDTTAIVMAQGEGTRWDLRRTGMQGAEFKHLVTVGSEALIERTARMLREHKVHRVLVVGHEEYRAAIEPSKLFTQDRTGPLLDGIAATHEFWKTDRVIFLLGDVLFSKDAMQTILDDESQIMFFGRVLLNRITGKNAPELYAFNMCRMSFEVVLEHCRWMATRGRPIRYPPKLWALNRLMGGLDHDAPTICSKLLTQIDDYTDDIDSPEEYRDFWPRMVYEALREEFER